MELEALLDKLKMEALGAQLDAVCEQAAKKDLDYPLCVNIQSNSTWSVLSVTFRALTERGNVRF